MCAQRPTVGWTVKSETYLSCAVLSPVCRPNQAAAEASGSPVLSGTPPPGSQLPPFQRTHRCPPQQRSAFPLGMCWMTGGWRLPFWSLSGCQLPVYTLTSRSCPTVSCACAKTVLSTKGTVLVQCFCFLLILFLINNIYLLTHVFSIGMKKPHISINKNNYQLVNLR